jgi:Zn ribbon nucleic-acid-binding protein
MDIIARKQNIQLTKNQHISQNFTVQYKCNEQNTRAMWLEEDLEESVCDVTCTIVTVNLGVPV